MPQLTLCSCCYGNVLQTFRDNILEWTGKSLTHFEVRLGRIHQQRRHQTPVFMISTGYEALRRLHYVKIHMLIQLGPQTRIHQMSACSVIIITVLLL